eukprot:TRINITY_DN106260_c0_g1_i1.p1 TRINITY_DN106260_c0_g1~~TRINITY_DN106260_c0_g1_i1.p1  ORF type:complete len:726 (-),score=109.51 TRINITY_DN106260_c0_g1_i1:141-2318(-)
MESRGLFVAVTAAVLQLTEAAWELKPSEPLTTLFENNFNDKANSTLKEGSTYSYIIGNGYKCDLTGFTHTRQYAMGFLRNKPGSASAQVSGLVPNAQYAWKIYQFAKNFKSANPLWVNGESHGKPYQDAKTEATKEGVTLADSSGRITFELRVEAHQFHLSGVAVAKIRPTCSKSQDSGYHAGISKRTFSASQAPNGKEWSWHQCAARCADDPACEFWTLEPLAGLGVLSSAGRCSLMSDKGNYVDAKGYVEGEKDTSCSEASGYISNIANLQNRVSVGELDLSQTKAAKKVLEDRVTLQDGQIQHLTDEKAQLTKSLEDTTRERDSVKQQLDSAKKQLESVSAELRSKSELLTDAQKEVQDKSTALEAKAQELNNLGQQLGSKTADLESKSRVFNEELTKKQKEWSFKLQEMAKQLKVTEEQHAELTAAYKDPSVQHFLEAKAWKVYEHPGVNHLVNKTFKYVLPSLQVRYGQGINFIENTHRSVYDKLNAFAGNGITEPYLPLISGILVYGIAFVPTCCAVMCLTRVLCRMREVLIFCHIWFMWSCLVACGFAIFAGREPLAVLAMHDASLYLFSQVVFGILLLVYTVMLMLSWLLCSAGGTGEPWYRLIQASLFVPILLSYFHFIFTPAMQDRLPEIDKMIQGMLRAVGSNRVGAFVWIPYMLAAAVFAAEGILELLSFRAAQYKNKLDTIAAKVDVRRLDELSALVPGKTTGDVELGDKSS